VKGSKGVHIWGLGLSRLKHWRDAVLDMFGCGLPVYVRRQVRGFRVFIFGIAGRDCALIYLSYIFGVLVLKH
jgi:hypothetical protein